MLAVLAIIPLMAACGDDPAGPVEGQMNGAAEVTVHAGSEIGGTTFPSEMKVDVAQAEDLVVEREITSPPVESDEAVLVTFDLNSDTWLTADAVNAGQAGNAAIEAAVTVSTEVVAR